MFVTCTIFSEFHRGPILDKIEIDKIDKLVIKLVAE